jgi:hypothetical protein
MSETERGREGGGDKGEREREREREISRLYEDINRLQWDLTTFTWVCKGRLPNF